MTTTASTKARSAGRPTAGAAEHIEARKAAIFQLCFAADRLTSISIHVGAVLRANLAYAGHQVPLEVKTTYSDYSPTGTGFGSLNCEVTGDFTGTKLANYQVRNLLEGLPVASSYGMQPNRMADIKGKLSFSLKLDQDDCRLAIFLAALEQERSLSKALDAMRNQVELAGVASLMGGAEPDAKTLQREQALKDEIAELERQLEEKREELTTASAAADKVRKRLRESSSPAMNNLITQVNTLRERIGKKLIP